MWGLKTLVFILFLSCSVSSYANSNTDPQSKRPTVGLVLSGGGAKGLAHIGVLKVLEEVGMPVDYVGGTSMGSIVAGLYAIGYSAKEIETMVLEQDWIQLLTDKIQRTNLSVREKEDFDKYLLTFPIENMKFKLPSGLGAGQNVSMLLSRLTLPVAGISDFNDFPRPFLCIATDIVTGEEVVLQNGYLPDAIRASMAIPTIFTPVQIGDNYLVDGGLVNNFPVEHVKAMGADIIIGVNLGLKEYSREDLENLAAVLEQSLFFKAKERNKVNQSKCDLIFQPDVYESSAASFSNVADLVEIGEVTARAKIERLRELVDSITNLGDSDKVVPSFEPVNSLYINEIKYEGLNNVTPSFVEGKLRMIIPGEIHINELEEGIERVYGTQFFKRITYKTENLSSDTVSLVVRVDEKTNDFIKIGGRFDSDLKAQLLVNATLRNKGIKGSKLSLDLYLGMYPLFKAEYRINTGWRSRRNPLFFKNQNLGVLPDIGLSSEFRSISLNYYDNYELISTYHFQYFTTGGFLSTSISNPLYLQGGVHYDFSLLEPIIKSEEGHVDNSSIDFYGKVVFDTYDDQVYAKKGNYFEFWADVIRDFNLPSDVFFQIMRGGFRYEKIFNMHRIFALQPYLNTGIALGDTVPPLRRMFLGGHSLHHTVVNSVYGFPGLRLMEIMNNSFYSAGIKLRVNPYGNHFITINNAFGRTDDTLKDLYSSLDNYLYGFGIKYGYKSLVGPVELGVSKSNQAVPWQFFINFGYWF